MYSMCLQFDVENLEIYLVLFIYVVKCGEKIVGVNILACLNRDWLQICMLYSL